MKKHWTYNECKIEALKYKTKTELRKNNSSLYEKIRREKWYELYTHMEIMGNRYNRLIYVYEFSDNYCYVGLTGDIKRRNKQHIQKNGSVFNHIQKTNLTPKLLLKTDYIDVIKASILEGEIVKEYKNNGWNILNKIKTGGIGGNQIIWNYELCKKEALKYSKISLFIKNSNGAYTAAKKNKWLDDICSHIKIRKTDNGYWNNKNICMNEMKKYNTKTEFCNNNSTAWKYAKLNGWLYEYYGKGNSNKSGVLSRKAVIQYDKQMNKLEEFLSTVEAGRILNINSTNIAAVCRGKDKSYKGFIFKYKS